MVLKPAQYLTNNFVVSMSVTLLVIVFHIRIWNCMPLMCQSSLTGWCCNVVPRVPEVVERGHNFRRLDDEKVKQTKLCMELEEIRRHQFDSEIGQLAL